MKVELKKVSYSARQSQETPCFFAEVHVNGVKKGTVENEGHGGPDRWSPWALEKEISDHAKTLPKYKDEQFEVGSQLISDLLNRHLVTKRIAAQMRSIAFFVDASGRLFQTKKLTDAHRASIAARPAEVLAKLKGTRFITDVEEVVALALAQSS